jgi:hypothetical protein
MADKEAIIKQITDLRTALNKAQKTIGEQDKLLASGKIQREHSFRIDLADVINNEDVIKELKNIFSEMCDMHDAGEKTDKVLLSQFEDALHVIENLLASEEGALKDIFLDLKTELRDLQVEDKKSDAEQLGKLTSIITAIKGIRFDFPSQTIIAGITKPIIDAIRTIKIPTFSLPKNPEDAVPVRLSDGDKFYEAVTQVFGGGGGGGNTPHVGGPNGQDYVPTMSGLSLPQFDFMSLAINSATETYTFKKSNTLVATVTIVYTDATRADILTVTKT